MAGESIPRRAAVALLVLFAFCWFSTLDYRKLIKPDEGRYAEIAREMAASGDWLTPRLNGIKYFEKPPLQYWASAAAFKAFGPDEWTARLWSALTGFAGVVLAFFAGRRLFGAGAGVLAGIVLGSSLWYLAIGHLNTLDMGLCFFLQLALCAFLFAQDSPPASAGERRWMLLAWAAMALAVLSKGLVGLVLPGATLALYCAVQRDLEPLKRMHFAAGIALFLVLAAPWFVAVSIANPEFPGFFFVHEHFERFLTTEHRRAQPAWYFVPVFALGMLPWTGMALHGAASAWRQGGPPGFHPHRFLAIWAAVVFLFFSASGSKLPSYILPLFPALALLAGAWLAQAHKPSLRWHVGVLVAVGLAAMLAFARFAGPQADPMLARYVQWLVAASALFAAGALLALWQTIAGRQFRALVLLGGSALLAGTLMLQGHEALGRSNSAYYIANHVKPWLTPGVPFYSVGMYDQTLPFYIERTVTLVNYRDEFDFGLRQQPGLSVPTIAEFRERWMRDPEALAVFTPDGWRLVQAERLPMEVIAEDTRRVIVRKPTPRGARP